jgi:hypothetical protein
MSPPSRATAWICLLNVSLMSCTTTNIIHPGDADAERMDDKEITLVVTNDGMRYTFDKPKPTVVGDSLIIGVKDGRSVVIPMSEVAAVYVSEPETGKTVLILLGIVVGVVVILALIMTAAVVHEVND